MPKLQLAHWARGDQHGFAGGVRALRVQDSDGGVSGVLQAAAGGQGRVDFNRPGGKLFLPSDQEGRLSL
jgi:hypothetical protein